MHPLSVVLLFFVQGHSDFINLNNFCLKATGQTGSRESNTGPLVLWFNFGLPVLVSFHPKTGDRAR